jgi:lysophospholipase L1-like esterase
MVGCLLIAGAGGYLYLTFSRPVGSGPAGPAVKPEAFAKPWSARPVWFVGLGDSVTAGFGAGKGYGYFDLLVSNSSADYPAMRGLCLSSVFPRLSVTNLSVSGSISHELLGSQLPRLPHFDTNAIGWVVITTGGNDLIHNYGRTPPREEAMFGATWDQAKAWIEQFEVRLNRILSGVQERFPGGCHIFIANIYDPTDGVGDLEPAGLPNWPEGPRILEAYNQVIRRCVEKHPKAHLIDFHQAFLGHGIHCAQFWAKHYQSQDPHYWYFTNLEDPNERGYDAIRRLFLLEMAQVAAGGL